MIPSATLPPIGGIIPNRRNHAQTVGIMPKRSESFHFLMTVAPKVTIFNFDREQYNHSAERETCP